VANSWGLITKTSKGDAVVNNFFLIDTVKRQMVGMENEKRLK
jgi:hypothetical protein